MFDPESSLWAIPVVVMLSLILLAVTYLLISAIMPLFKKLSKLWRGPKTILPSQSEESSNSEEA